MLVVVDTQRGNLLSMCNALDYLGAEFVVAKEPEQISAADRLIIPGVGAFKSGIEGLHERGMVQPLDEARARGVPILGVCLGMQLLARRSFEGGETKGLGWIEGDVVRLAPPGLRVPHVGWNETTARPGSPLFRGVEGNVDFYYVHSFHLAPDDSEVVDATCEYGLTVTTAVRSGNVAGVQFHPEKSQDVGLAVLENFLRWNP